MLKQNLICRSSVLYRSLKVKYGRHSSNLVSVTSSKDTSNLTYPPVADFYAGKSVFLTGGTGFLGKVFIEKLLYSCQDLDKLYMLIRDKKGANINDRLEQMFRNPLFARLRTDRPELLRKVIPVTGDLTLPNLGINLEDEQELINKVSVVIHSGATVRFDEPLSVAMKINYEGTVKVLDVCKRMNNIKVFMYISSAFAHTKRQTIEEVLYPPPAEVSDVYKFIEKHDSDKKETMKFIDGRPNTYTFTKALTESYVAENHGHVPAIIVRPSAVTAIKDGPMKGWLDNWFGFTRIYNDVSKGWNRVTLAKSTGVMDLIPVDYVCNLCIVAAATRNKPTATQVLNCCTSSENPITTYDAYKFMINEAYRSGQYEAPYPFNIYTQSRTVVKILTIILQMAPAYIADLLLRIRGKEAKYVKIQLRVTNLRDSIEYFTLHSWIMKSAKARELSSNLSHHDKVKFPCDPTNITWDEYMTDYCQGIYKYLQPKNIKQ